MFNTVEGKRILKFGGLVLIMLVVFLVVEVIYTLRLTAHVSESTPAMNVITVNGKGEVLAVPDIANFTFGADETAKTVSDAQKAVTDKVNKGIDIAKAAGVDEKDIKTVSYNIFPHYQYTQTVCSVNYCPPGKQVIDGYEVSQTIQVKVRDTAKAGDILGKLGAVQLNNISGLNFTIDDEDKVLTEAKDKAIADAQQKAKDLARSLGVHLGKIVSFGDNGYPMPIYAQSAMKETMLGAGDAANVQVPAGQNTITSNVSITYEIK